MIISDRELYGEQRTEVYMTGPDRRFALHTVEFVLCVVLCAVFFSGCSQNRYIDRVQQLEEGVSNPTTIPELKEAISKYEKRVVDIVNAQAKTGLWYNILATRYIDSQMYGEALAALQHAVSYYPANQNLYYYIGVCAGYMANASLDFDATGDTSKRDRYLALAESAYLRALAIDPRYARALYGLGVLYVFEMDKDAEAIPYLETLLTVEKKNYDAMFVLARAYYATGEYEKAIGMYDRVIADSKSAERKADAEANKKIVLDVMYE